MAYLRLNIWHMLKYLREELLLILGTSTAEPALPGLMRKLEYAGVSRPTVGLVVPTGYSFNLDGAAIYLSLAALYIAQATNTPLTIGQQLGMLAVMLLTSKGAAGVVGGGFIALTATLSTLGHIPVVGIMLIFGIDKFMSECRALVNFIGDSVATLFVAKWNHELESTGPEPYLPARTWNRCSTPARTSTSTRTTRPTMSSSEPTPARHCNATPPTPVHPGNWRPPDPAETGQHCAPRRRRRRRSPVTAHGPITPSTCPPH